MGNPTFSESKNVPMASPQQEVLPPNKLDNIVDAVDDLATEKAALKRLRELRIAEVENDFELGGVLSRIKDEEWFDGHESFEELCKAEFGFRKSKGYQLVVMYRTLIEMGVAWDDVKIVGSAKLRLLCTKAIAKKFDPVEFSTRVEIGKSMTFLEFQDALQGANPNGSKTKAKDDGNSESDAVAPEPIHDEFVGQAPKDVKTGAEPEATGDKSTGPDADAVQTSTKAAPNGLPEFDLDAVPNPFVINHMKEIGKSLTLALCCEAFPGWGLIEEQD